MARDPKQMLVKLIKDRPAGGGATSGYSATASWEEDKTHAEVASQGDSIPEALRALAEAYETLKSS